MIRKMMVVSLLAVLAVTMILPGMAFAVDVSLNLSDTKVSAGDSVTASGVADPDVWVSIKILDNESGNIVFFDAVKSDGNGDYSITFKVPAGTSDSLTCVAGYGSNVATAVMSIGSGGSTPGGSGGGGGGGGGGGSTPTPSRPPGSLKPVSDEAVDRALQSAGSNGVAKLEEASGATGIALTTQQLKAIKNAGVSVALTVNSVTFQLPPADPAQLADAGGVQVQFNAQQLSAADAANLASQAANAALFELGGAVWELSAVIVAANGTQTNVAGFDSPIQISLPVPADQRAAAEAGNLTVGYYNPATNAWEQINGTYNGTDHTMTFSTRHLSKYALLKKKETEPAGTVKTFADIQGHWAQKDIELMAGRGIAGGTAPDRFDPDGKVTRAQFAAFLIRSLGIAEEQPAVANFKDVSPGDWFYATVETAYANGLIKGRGEGIIDPNANITRQEIAVMVVRALSREGLAVTVDNPDAVLAQFVDAGEIAYRNDAAVAVQQKIVGGRDATHFAPKANASRAEAVVMLKRMMDLL